MRPIHAQDERFIKVELKEHTALFSEMRIDRNSIPENLYVYEVRHADEDWSEPCQICRGIMVNFYGTLITKVPLLKAEETEMLLEGNEWKFLDQYEQGLENWNGN